MEKHVFARTNKVRTAIRGFVFGVMALAFSFAVEPVRAQPSVAGVKYFQPGYAYRHMANPAFVPQWGYVGIPVAGLLNLNLNSNVGLADFLYPVGRGSDLGTFLHPDVSSEEFLSGIKKNNHLGIAFNTNVLSAGWFWGKGFWNFHVAVRGSLSAEVPYAFFDFLKNQMSANPSNYVIENMELAMQAYAEVGIGYSRVLNDEFTVGGKFKFLVGLAGAELRLERMDVRLSDEAWNIGSEADFRVFGRLLEAEMPEGGLPSFGLGSISPSGYGAAIDLGAEYRPSFLPGLRFSLSLLDLGFISYSQADVSQYESKGDVLFEGIDNISTDLDVDGIVDDLVSDIEGMIAFEESPADKGMSRMVNPSLNIGAEYGFWGNRFSVGLLNTTTFYHTGAETEVTVVANIHPVRWFSASLAYSFLGGANGFGWALNFTPSAGLNLFIASNYTPLKISPQFIPLERAHANLQFGLTVPIGRNRAYTQDKDPHNVNVFPYSFKDPENHPNKVMLRKAKKSRK